MPLHITRRKFLIASLSLTGATYLNPEWVLGADKKPLRFGLVGDSHYADRVPGGTRYYRQSLDKMKECIKLFNQEKVDFIIHLGDFKDQDKHKKEVDTLSYLIDLEKEFAKFKGARYHCVGNHDVDSIRKSQFLANIENTNIAKDQSYYTFTQKACQFIVLDANYHADGSDHFYQEGVDWQDTRITLSQINWLKATLETAKLPVIVFCHHPLYEFIRDEKIYHVSNHTALRKILENSKKVMAVFQGHTHQEDHQEINGIHYVTMLGMVDYDGPENNAYAIVEVFPGQKLEVIGFRRTKSKSFS